MSVCFRSLKPGSQRPEVFRGNAEDGEGGESHGRHSGAGWGRHGRQRGGRRSGGQRQRSGAVGGPGAVVRYPQPLSDASFLTNQTFKADPGRFLTSILLNLLNNHEAHSRSRLVIASTDNRKKCITVSESAK